MVLLAQVNGSWTIKQKIGTFTLNSMDNNNNDDDNKKNYYYTVSQKVHHQVFIKTSSNIDQFSQFFHCHTLQGICNKVTAKIPPHLKHVTTLPCEI